MSCYDFVSCSGVNHLSHFLLHIDPDVDMMFETDKLCSKGIVLYGNDNNYCLSFT